MINLKDELLKNKEINNKEEILAEIFGMLLAKNAITEEGIFYRTDNKEIIDRIYGNISGISKVNIDIVTFNNSKNIENVSYLLSILNDKSDEYTDLIMLLYKNKKVDEDMISHIIRGFFLSSGYLKEPRKGHSLVFFLDNEDTAIFLYLLFKKINKRVYQAEKQDKMVVYLTNIEDILDIIIMLGGINTFFEYEEITIEKEIRNKINRNINYEIANETKKLMTSNKQIDMIKYILANRDKVELTDILIDTMQLRLENEELSLQELAEKIDISKSGIRNRFRRIEKVYQELIEKSLDE